MIPQFLFWDQTYWLAPNSKFQLATKDQEMYEQDELPQSIQDKDFLIKTELV